MAAEHQTTAAKPWEANRAGDPRQLRHEAKVFELLAKEHRKDAERLRREAVESDGHADHYIEVAADYRKWAAEQEALNA